jgi:hypothetical protein
LPHKIAAHVGHPLQRRNGAAIGTGCVVDVTMMAVRSMLTWSAKALPVDFWHMLQWHA